MHGAGSISRFNMPQESYATLRVPWTSSEEYCERLVTLNYIQEWLALIFCSPHKSPHRMVVLGLEDFWIRVGIAVEV